MARISTADLNSILEAPIGPGAVIANFASDGADGYVITPDSIEAALNGDTTAGTLLGAMTSAPSVEISHETQDLTENLVGINARLKGATQLQRSDASLSVELVQLNPVTIPILDPTLDQADWSDGDATTPAVIGKRWRNRGFIESGSYLNNVVMVQENLDNRVYFAIAVYNAIALDSTEFSFDDEGNVAGVSLELMGHSGPESRDAVTGQYLSPYEIFRLNLPTDPVVV